MSSRAYSTRGRGRGSSANNGERNSYDNRDRSGSQPSPGTHQTRGRGRGSSANNGERNSYEHRDRSGSQPSPGAYQTRGRGRGSSAERGSYANSGNRGGYDNQAQRGNSNRTGQNGDRGQHSENSKLVDYSLISSQNVQWKYDSSKIGLVKPEFVTRNTHLTETCGRKIKLMTNHFLFNFVPGVCIFHYNFVWTSQDKDETKPKTKKLGRDDCYILFDEVRKKYKSDFRNSSVGYDGNANVYLPYKLNDGLVDAPVSVELDGQIHDFKVTLTLVKRIPLSVLSQYYNGSQTDDIRRESLLEAIQALHIILKFPSRNSMIALGRLAMFPTDGDRYSLSDWIELALGHRKSIRFSETGLTLVVDRAAAAFLKSDDPTNFIQYIFNLNSPKDFQVRPDRLSLLRRTFANIKICTDHLGYSKKYDVKGITDKPASDDTFKLNENGITYEVKIADYFSKKYKKLKYPNLPCILTSNGGKIPIEVCKIVRNQSLQSIKRNLTALEQREMINQTATAPDERFTCLLQAHKQIHEQINEALPDFKINIDIKPIGVNGIVLNSPSLLYQGQILGPQETRLGAWNLVDKVFYKTKTFGKFGVLDLCGLGNAEKEFREKFIQKAAEMKMIARSDSNMTRLITITDYDNRDRGSEKNRNLEARICQTLSNFKAEEYAFVLCIFPEDKWVYNLTKRVADIDVHIPTQGISRRNVLAGSFQTIANILAKINKKLGGVNVILKHDEKPALLRKRIMIIGADVTHPGEADELHSSVAASVSTYDKDHTMFYPSIRVQPKKDATKKTVEIIREFQSMVADHLENFSRINNFLPDVILYLRDGVSEGQYSQILNDEVKHLLNPEGDYKPKVTAVIISKRILTRTKPVDPKEGVGKFKNVPPGTTIDSIITHPSDLDYFQYGHKGIKGTSRPCHYYMVHDDNNLTTDEMAKISYYLCFIFERATSSTSAPAPVMHAHNLAFKARQWISSDENRFDYRGLKGQERFDAECSAASLLNSRYSNIEAAFANSSMFYI